MLEEIYRFNVFHLMPAALIGLVAAVVILIATRRKNGARSGCTRPGYVRPLRTAALILFIFAALSLVVFPVVYYIIMFIKFGTAIFYS